MEQEVQWEVDIFVVCVWEVQSVLWINCVGCLIVYYFILEFIVLLMVDFELLVVVCVVFVIKYLWVICYELGQIWLVGCYLNVYQGGVGFLEYIVWNCFIDGEDFVLWYMFGFMYFF